MATAWIETADRLPAITNEESDWVLVRLASGGVYVAQLRESIYSWGPADEDHEIRTHWILRGQDGYEHDLTDVVAWTEIPA